MALPTTPLPPAPAVTLPILADGTVGTPSWQEPANSASGPAPQDASTQGGEAQGASTQAPSTQGGGGSVTRDQANEQQSQTEQPNGPNQQQQVGAPCGSDSSMYVFLALPLLIYFMIIRPQQKQEKARKEMQSGVKKGTKVVMVSGLHGTVQSINDQVVTIKVDGDVKMKFDRSSIARVESGADEAAQIESGDAKS